MRLNPWIIAGGIAGLLIVGRHTETGNYYMTAAANALGLVTDEQRANYAKYMPTIQKAEADHGLPAGLLARLLKKESSYLTSIITGERKSPVGALGIAQFMPATAKELGINPLDPAQAIPGAARYLAGLKRSLGTWDKAVAAYNWGIGNVQRKGLAAAPKETRDYVLAITGARIA